jgi:hypothetical protein
MSLLGTKLVPLNVMVLVLAWQACVREAGQPAATNAEAAFPGADWASRMPKQLGLSREKLDALRGFVRGRECVVRRGYMAYAWSDQQKSSVGQKDPVTIRDGKCIAFSGRNW